MDAASVQALAESVSALAGVLLIPAAILAWRTAAKDVEQQREQHLSQLEAQGNQHRTQMAGIEVARKAAFRPAVVIQWAGLADTGVEVDAQNVGSGPAFAVQVRGYPDASGYDPLSPSQVRQIVDNNVGHFERGGEFAVDGFVAAIPSGNIAENWLVELSEVERWDIANKRGVFFWVADFNDVFGEHFTTSGHLPLSPRR